MPLIFWKIKPQLLKSYILYKDEMVFLFIFVCMYVRNLYKFTFLNRSQPNFAHVSPLVWKRPRVCMGPKFMTSSILWVFFIWGPLQNHGHKMAANVTVFRYTVMSMVPAGVRVTSPTLRCRRRRNHPQQPYIRNSRGSSSNVAEITS
jgi:hypothetical protein